MKSTSIVVAALFSALTLPVFAQTAAPAAADAVAKAPHAAKHKAVKHAKKMEGKAATAKSVKPADGAVPVK